MSIPKQKYKCQTTKRKIQGTEKVNISEEGIAQEVIKVWELKIFL